MHPQYSVKPMKNNYISKSMARNHSWENSSTGRKHSDKTFDFVNQTTNDVRCSNKYTWNLQNPNASIEVEGGRKKISANIYKKKSSKGKYPSDIK